MESLPAEPKLEESAVASNRLESYVRLVVVKGSRHSRMKIGRLGV